MGEPVSSSISFGTGREKKLTRRLAASRLPRFPGHDRPGQSTRPPRRPGRARLDLCPDPGAITERADRAAVGTLVRHPLRCRPPPSRGPSRTSLPQRCSSRGQFSNIVVAPWFAGEHRCHNDVGGGGRGRTSLPQRCWRRRARANKAGEAAAAPGAKPGRLTPHSGRTLAAHFSLSENSTAPSPSPPRPGTIFGFDATPYTSAGSGGRCNSAGRWRFSVVTVSGGRPCRVRAVAGGRPLGPGPWLAAAQGPQRLRGQGRPQAVAAGDAEQP